MNDRWQDVEAIKALKARYFRFMDTKAWPELLALFSPDATIAFPDDLGREFPDANSFVEMAAELMANVTSIHMGYMPEITLNDDGTADAIWGMSDDLDAPAGMPQSGGKPIRMRGAGHYHEHYIQEDGHWKIKRMTLSRLRLELS
jgi:ketosteroid isomerase-like protein